MPRYRSEAERSDSGIRIGGVLLGEITRRRSRGMGRPPRAIVGDDYEVICYDFSSADSLLECDFDRAGVLFLLWSRISCNWKVGFDTHESVIWNRILWFKRFVFPCCNSSLVYIANPTLRCYRYCSSATPASKPCSTVFSFWPIVIWWSLSRSYLIIIPNHSMQDLLQRYLSNLTCICFTFFLVNGY